MKSYKKQSGFTIVELLIVIVVIGILAAITIVAYNGIQNRSKDTAAKSLANQISKKAEAYNSVGSNYPLLKTNFATQKESTLGNAGAVVLADPIDQNSVGYKTCDSGKGYQIVYWQSTGVTTLNGGTTASCAYPAS